MSGLKVVIEATSLLLRSAGVKNYTHYWLAALREAARRSGDTITTFPPGVRADGAVNHEQIEGRRGSDFLRLKRVQFSNLRGNTLLEGMLADAEVFA
mgnify:CR=1 FL=1